MIKNEGHAKHFVVFIYSLLSYAVGIVSLSWKIFQDITLRLFLDPMASTVTQLYTNIFAFAVIYQDRNKFSEAELWWPLAVHVPEWYTRDTLQGKVCKSVVFQPGFCLKGNLAFKLCYIIV